MMRRQHSRILVPLVLAAALVAAYGAEVRADGLQDRLHGSFHRGQVSKPNASPLQGEPDVPQGGPLPPKVGPYPTGGATLSNWALRFHWSLRILLMQLPTRLP